MLYLISVIIISYFLAIWLYSVAHKYMLRFMFLGLGWIVLTIFYVIIIGIYLGQFFDPTGWEVTVITGSTLFLLVAGAKVLSVVQILIIKSKLKSGNIGKNFLESKNLNYKIDRLIKKKQLDVSADRRLEEFEVVEESDTDTPFGVFSDVGEDERLEEFKEVVKWGSFKHLLLLIEQGVDYHPHIKKSLLLIDTWSWQKAVILIRLGADVNTFNDKGETPLIYAARLGDPKLIQVLIAAGADTKVQTKNGKNALIYLIHGLASSRIKDISFVILSQVCDINARDNEGMTAIMHAIKRDFDTRVNYLLKKGASIINGHNVIEWAKENGASESILKKLQKAQEKKVSR